MGQDPIDGIYVEKLFHDISLFFFYHTTIGPMETESMKACVNHPDKPAGLVCMKCQIHLCEQCARFREPNRYGKHRTGCPIWFVARDSGNGWGMTEG